MALYELDRAHYQNAKRELVKRFQEDLYPTSTLARYLDQPATLEFFQARTDEARETTRQELERLFEEIVSLDWSIFLVRLLDAEYNEVGVESSAPEKLREYNTFRNCLFSRKFEGALYRTVIPPGPALETPKPVGRIQVAWTTPKNWREVERLTERYRVIAAALAVGITLIFLGFFSTIILPQRRVSAAIDESIRRQTTLILRPASGLERGFNDLARDALFMRLHGHAQALIASQPFLDPARLLADLARQTGERFRFAGVSVREWRRASDDGEMAPAPPHVWKATDADAPDMAIVETGERQALEAGPPPGGARWESLDAVFLARTIPAAEGEARERNTLTIALDPARYRAAPEWAETTADRLAETLGNALEALRLQQANVLRQKSEANINLAENLGHDLTNIIATAKLDLTTLRQVLDAEAGGGEPVERHAGTLRESVHHLLANTRFLQEIVNIYRAFTNLKKPQYETVDLAALVRETAELFHSSTSGSTRLVCEAEDGLAPCRVEPRLIKLALFNLFTNASDAIKEAQAGGMAGEGLIRLSLTRDPAAGQARIAVSDNGPGIRNAKGELATPEEIRHIFHLGYSTKKENLSEGLGLSWVRSIVAEFHQGRLEALNKPDGGAEFCLYLPAGPSPGARTTA